MVHKHNSKCDLKNVKIYDNEIEIEKSLIEYKEFKKKMIEYLNKNPLSSYKQFKIYVNKYLFKNEISFEINKSTLADIYYPWHNNAKFFSCYSI